MISMRTFAAITGQIFNIPEAEIQDTLSSHDIPAWDSMNYIFFIAELEKEFGFSFTTDEVLTAQCLGDLRRIVEQRAKR